MSNQTRSDTRLLRLNVGFLLKEGAGYSREFVFDEPGTLLLEDVAIEGLHGTLRLTRTPQGILVQGTLHTQAAAECVRCLAPFSLPYDVTFSDLFTYDPNTFVARDPYNPYVVDEGGFIDLTPIMREEGILALPIQPLCAPDCKGLCPTCGQDLNEGTCNCEREHIDPRLASLRALLDD